MNEEQGRFVELLKQESNLLDDLFQLLEQEKDVLKARDNGLLEALIDSKNEILNKISILDKQRELFMTNQNQMDSTSERFKKTSKDISEELSAKLERCKIQNKINGGLIEVSKLFNEKIINIVRGYAEQQMTYNETGTNIGHQSQQSIARV